MAKDKRPALQFYVGDWMKDPDLRACSYAARGLWIDMLCLMYESSRRGYLLVKDKPASLPHIARMSGGGTDEASPLLKELEDAGVFSRNADGAIYCRRMVRDAKRSETYRQNGSKGGNPALVGDLDNQKSNPPDKPKVIPFVEDEDAVPSLSSGSKKREAFEVFFDEYPPDKRSTATLARVVWYRENLDDCADLVLKALRTAKSNPQFVTTYAPRSDKWLDGKPWRSSGEVVAQDPKDRRPGESDAEYSLRILKMEAAHAV